MSTAVLTINSKKKTMPSGKKRSDASLFSSRCMTNDTPAAVSITRDTPTDKSKIKHAAMLLPEKLEHAASTKIKHASQLVPVDASSKKRSASDEPTAAALVTPPPSKRRRSDGYVSIQRTPLKKDLKKIPEPPTEDPPEPTKFLKVLLLGPAGQGKQNWVQGLSPSVPGPAAVATSTTNNSFRVDYYSKDYSFEASSAVQETVRLQMYSVDCDSTKEPPATWTHSLVPSMQHVVLVLDLFVAQDAKETLRSWKIWLERYVTGKRSKSIPVSLLLVHSKKADSVSFPPSAWFKLGATVEKLCRYWHINKWYMMENQETSSDIILQTMIERTWSVMGLLPQAAKPPQAGNKEVKAKDGEVIPQNATPNPVVNTIEICDG